MPSDTGPDHAALTDHAARNRTMWDGYSDEYQATHGDDLAASGGYAWGTTQIPESELQILGDVGGRDILEFGCGAAQWSIALAAARRSTRSGLTCRSASFSTRAG